ncbi:diphthamide synthesis protein [Candidatus Pacearchaeota archaeon]|nr:diphthamide synthesis protein [Candidatus Pacearchaeota archaeon]
MKAQRVPASNGSKSTKVLLIETKRKFKDHDVNLSLLNSLRGKTISLAATIQYIDLVPKVKSYLESKNKKVIIKQGARHKAHVLGCNSTALDKTADEILIITDGKFHAINNAIQIQKPIYIFSGQTLEQITQEEIDAHNKKTLAKQKKFLLSDSVALILSTKHGQHHEQIEKIKDKIKALNKSVYIFEANNINTQEFENFPQIGLWINTACFGLARDDPRIVNLQDIIQFLK